MIYYGFDEVLYGWDRYFDLCNMFELRNAEDSSDAPSIKTLNRWRVDSPKGFAWLLHTDPVVVEELVRAYESGSSEVTAAMDNALDRTEERAHALAAKAVVVETPPELMPSDVSRAALANLGERWQQKSSRRLIWEAAGLWSAEDGRSVASEAGAVYAVDPFILARDQVELGKGGDAAFRITERAAARRQFDAWEMEQVLDWADRFDRTFIMLAGRYKIEHAKELSVLLERAGE